MRISKYIIPFLLFGFLHTASAQFTMYHEIGIVGGPQLFKSDYGARNDFQTNMENSGYTVGFVHYMNFAYTGFRHRDLETFLRENVKVRSELSYSHSYFRHWGQWVEGPPTSSDVIQLKNMRGETSLINIGVGAEISLFKNIHEFEMTDRGFGPFASIGVQFSHFMPEVYSLLGPLDEPGVLFPKFVGGVRTDSGNTFSLTGSIGTRYKIDVMNDLIFDFGGQYYFSDWVDGLNPPPDMNPGNKYNDWAIWFKIGYIRYLGENL